MNALPSDELGTAWRAARPQPAVVHLNSAACSRQSEQVLAAVARHARHEAEVGAHVAEAAAEGLLQQGCSVLAGLVGMAAADVAFVESAQAALTALLIGWRLPAGTRVACLPGEYAPNIAQLRTYGLRPEPLPVDGITSALADHDLAWHLAEGAELDAFIGDAAVLTDDYAPVDQLLTPYG